jgi:hypothetical protein
MFYDCYKNTVKATTFLYAKNRRPADNATITKETIMAWRRLFLLAPGKKAAGGSRLA